MKPKRSLLVSLIALAGFSQDAAPPPTGEKLRVSVELVQIDAVVSDAHGHPVPKLQAADFDLLVDGVPRPITYFDEHHSAPKPVTRPGGDPVSAPPAPQRSQIRTTVALLIDDLSLSATSVPAVRSAVRRYVENDLDAAALTAIVRASAGIGALQDFTTDRRILLAAADRIHWAPGWNARVSAYQAITPEMANRPDSVIAEENAREAGAVRLALDSVCRVVKGMEGLPGRKAVILFSDGLPLSKRSQTRATAGGAETLSVWESTGAEGVFGNCVRQAARAGVVISAIDTRGLQSLAGSAADQMAQPDQYKAAVSGNAAIEDAPAPRAKRSGGHLVTAPTSAPGDWVRAATGERRQEHEDRMSGAQFLAANTGGIFVSESNDLLASMRAAVADLDSYYVLGFAPPKEAFERLPSGRPAYHRIQLKAHNASYRIRTRSGFFGEEDSDAERPRQASLELGTALVSPFRSSEIHLEARCSSLRAGSQAFLFVSLSVAARDLQISGPEINRGATIQLLLRAYDADGAAMEGGIDKVLRVSLDPTGFAKALKNGLVYTTLIPIPKPGPYEVRAAVLDTGSGKIGGANDFVWVPKPDAKGLSLSNPVFSNWLGKDDDITPAEQPPYFTPGQLVRLSVEVTGRGEQSGLSGSVQLLRDGVVVMSGDRRPLYLEAGRHRSSVARVEFTLPKDLQPGDYAVHLEVFQPSGRSQAQWARLRVESP